MPELWRIGPQSLKQLDLRRRIGHMVLAANDMADLEINIINDAWQCIKIAPALPDHHRVGKRSRINFLLAAHQIMPNDTCDDRA